MDSGWLKVTPMDWHWERPTPMVISTLTVTAMHWVTVWDLDWD